MKIKTVEIHNFRLIEKETINLDDKITLVVGKNNSGKSSLVDLFCEFLEKPNFKFMLTDFSCSSHSKFDDAYNCYLEYRKAQKEKQEEKILVKKKELVINTLPKIELKIVIEYDKGNEKSKGDYLASLSEFITDLDEKSNVANICIEYSCDDIDRFFLAYESELKNGEDANLLQFTEKKLQLYYSSKYFAGDKTKEKYHRQIETNPIGRISNIFLTRTVSAQRYIFSKSNTNENSSNSNSLAGGFSEYYKHTNKETAEINDIKNALKSIEDDLEGKYNSLFKSILNDIKNFGAETPTKIPDVEIKSNFNTDNVLKNNINYFYRKGEVLLPEKNNGLGYNNLIYMVLRFASFFEELNNREPNSEFLLLFVEEPEAYMHPQMQQLFIRNIKSFIDNNGGNAQIVITTHSSHILSESGIDEEKGFDRIRYFDISTQNLSIKDLSDLKIEGEKKENRKTIKFLRQYLSTQKCDLFFADYVILVEGTTERLIMPLMIEKVVPDLNNKYISIIEVGGAYAHKFKELLNFINVPTLVLTDIDSIDITANRSACKVEKGDNFETSNQTLIKFLNKKKIEELLNLSSEKKLNGNIYISYQIPENTELNCGRSFEEAFILGNSNELSGHADSLNASNDFFNKYDSDALKNESYELTKELLNKVSKTDFAFDIMLTENWNVPLYIAQGLEWLLNNTKK